MNFQLEEVQKQLKQIRMEREAREKYEAANGPVTQMSAADAKSWAAWLCDPWPWNFQEGGTK